MHKMEKSSEVSVILKKTPTGFFLFEKKLKKSIFSKFLKLSGDGSYRIWTGLGVLFRPPDRFITPQVVFQKSRFFAQKTRFFSFLLIGGKNAFLTKKSIFFKVPQTFRGWFLSDLDRLRGVVSTSKPFYCTSCHFSEKSIFCLKNAFFQFFAYRG